MLTELALAPGVEAEHVVSAVHADLRSGDPWDVVVDSARGAGKRTLVHTLRTGAEAASACAALALRVLERTAVAVSKQAPAGAPVTAERIPIGAARCGQVAAIRVQLGAARAGITVDTANQLQGREYDVTMVLHLLSARRDTTAFHLESGGLCVLTSRHRHACILVERDGIAELLDAHPTTESVYLNVPGKFPDGWGANQSMMAHFAPRKVRCHD